jgi:hypothetical protein
MICDVLLPGAAVASITTASLGGLNTTAGKQEALSCKTNFPVMYIASLVNAVLEGNKRRLGICPSFENQRFELYMNSN